MNSVGKGFPTTNIQKGHSFYDLDEGSIWVFLGGDPREPASWKLLNGIFVTNPDTSEWANNQICAIWYNLSERRLKSWNGTNVIDIAPNLGINVIDFGADRTGVADASTSIQSAIDTAAANGGGYVYIPSGVYKILTSLILQTNVLVYGDGYNVSKDGLFNVVGGTILRGDGTIPCFAYNATDLGADYPTIAAALAAAQTSVRLHNLAMDTFTYGVKGGALYATGYFESQFNNLLATNCNQWGFYFENTSNSDFRMLKTSHCGTPGDGTTGQMAFGSSQGPYNHGNNYCAHLFSVYGEDGTWGIKIFARETSEFNDHNVYGIQCNTSNTKFSQAATMSGGSPNITVTDGTKFTVDMPVTFATSANGFIQYQTYFVISQVGNVIQVANMLGGTAVNATGSAAVNIERYGYPGVAVVATPTSFIQPLVLSGVDSEGIATCQVLLQRAYVNADLGYINGGQGTANATSVVNRGCFGNIRATQPISYDSDFNSGLFSNGLLLRTGDTQPSPQYPPLGVYRDKNSRVVQSTGGVLVQSGAAIAAPTTGVESIVATITILGKQLGRNGSARLTIHATCSNTATAKTVRVRFSGIGGTIITERNINNTTGGEFLLSFANRNSESSQQASLISGQLDTGTVFAWGSTTPAVDTTQDTTVVITVQSTEAVTIQRYLFEMFPGQ